MDTFVMHVLHELDNSQENRVAVETMNEDIASDTDVLSGIEAIEWDVGNTIELAQAYVLNQPLEGIFTPEDGLRHGTAFPNLSQPYMGRLVVPPCEKGL